MGSADSVLEPPIDERHAHQDEEREEARKRYESEIGLLERIGFNPDVDPEAAQAALRMASERNRAYLKSIGKLDKNTPDFHLTFADLMRTGRAPGGGAATTAQPQAGPSMDTQVPNLFSTEGAHLAPQVQAQPSGVPAQSAGNQRPFNFWRDREAEELARQQQLEGAKSIAKQRELGEKMALIDRQVEAKQITPEAGARAKASLAVGFPIQAERATEPNYELFTGPQGDVQYVAEGGKIPAGYQPYEKDSAPKAGSFVARYEDKITQLKATNPQLGDTDIHQLAIADLKREDDQKAAEDALDIKLKQGRLAALGKQLKGGNDKKGGMTPAQAGVVLRAAQADASRLRSDLMVQQSFDNDPAKKQAQLKAIEDQVSDRLESYVEEVFGMSLQDVQMIAQGVDQQSADEYMRQLTGGR